MNVKIYPGQIESESLEEFDWVGSVHDFFVGHGADPDSKDIQPVCCYVNGVLCEDWKNTSIGKNDTLEIRPNPKAAVAAWVYYVIAAVAVVAAFTMRPNAPSTNRNSTQGRQLNTAETQANVAKLNQVVPELIGRHVRYPDYLVQPRRFFQNEREQWLDLFLCIGPGHYAVEDVRIGNSPLTTLDGASYTIFEPGADVSGVEAIQNWYAAPEVGGTSTGGAGLELSSITEDSVWTPTASFYRINGDTIEADTEFPAFFEDGITADIFIKENYSVQNVRYGTLPSNRYTVSYFTGRFSGIRGLAVGHRVKSGYGELSILTLDDLGDGNLKLSFSIYNQELSQWVRLYIADGNYNTYFGHNGTFTITEVSPDFKTISVVANGSTAWSGFVDDDYPAASVSIIPYLPNFGTWSGPFYAAPRTESPDTFEIDVYFPSGLIYIDDNGKSQWRSVTLELQYRRGSASAWTSDVFSYSSNTLDQIGYTRRYTAPGTGPLQVRMRRRTLASTSTQVQDKVQWYGLRSLLRTPTSYAGWTTMSVRVQGLGQIAQSSENRVSVYATRIIPTIASETPTPTRDISAAVLHILRSSGYPLTNVDMQALEDLHELWSDREEYADGVFDDGTVGAALEQVLMAGMSEYTIENGLFRPIREGVRTIADHEQVFSAENQTSFSRTFSALKPDSNDGVEIEFQDASDSFATKKIVCKLPDSLGVKLERIKLNTVTDRTQAYRIGMRRACEQRYRRWQYQWATELDARNCSYKGYQLLIPESTSMGQSVTIERVANGVIYVSQPLQWSDSNVFGLKDSDGRFVGPFPAVRFADDSIISDVECKPGDVLFFGKTHKVTHHVLTTKIQHQGNKTTATGVNYDARIYQYDDEQAPAE